MECGFSEYITGPYRLSINKQVALLRNVSKRKTKSTPDYAMDACATRKVKGSRNNMYSGDTETKQ